jgi:hypothetical protein
MILTLIGHMPELLVVFKGEPGKREKYSNSLYFRKGRLGAAAWEGFAFKI